MKGNVVNLLWTSGWDSTYRLMDLISKGKTVQPHYISFKQRKSTQMEIKRMGEIKMYVQNKGYLTEGNILPTKIIDSEEIKINPEIQESYERLKSKSYLGNQYVLISSFARNAGINGLELSVHADDTVYKFLKDVVEIVKKDGDSYYELPRNLEGNTANVFGGLRFPLLQLSKVEMENKAKEKGFEDVMEKTWFCHTPTKNGQPCGKCNPCIYTVEEGLGRRLPFTSRIKAKPAKFLKSVRKTLTGQ